MISLNISKLNEAIPNSKTFVSIVLQFSDWASSHMITLHANLEENPRWAGVYFREKLEMIKKIKNYCRPYLTQTPLHVRA